LLDAVLPVLKETAPTTPPEATEAVIRSTDPEPEPVLRPLTSATDPPKPWPPDEPAEKSTAPPSRAAVFEFPADRNSMPASPDRDCPTTTLTDPAVPLVALPLSTISQPELPFTEVPEDRSTLPDTPAEVTLALVMTTEPEPELTPVPLRSTAFPPICMPKARPPDTSMLPPLTAAADVAPASSCREPPVPERPAPAVMLILPALPLVPEPVAIST
jgi:hypothetical protein